MAPVLGTAQAADNATTARPLLHMCCASRLLSLLHLITCRIVRLNDAQKKIRPRGTTFCHNCTAGSGRWCMLSEGTCGQHTHMHLDVSVGHCTGIQSKWGKLCGLFVYSWASLFMLGTASIMHMRAVRASRSGLSKNMIPHGCHGLFQLLNYLAALSRSSNC